MAMQVALWLVLILILLVALLGILIYLGASLLAVEIRARRRLAKRAQHDYRSARGTQHLAQLQAVFPALRRDLGARQARVADLQRKFDRLHSEYMTALHKALSAHLIHERLTEIPGIGPTLSTRVAHYCFRGSLADLHYAYRVQGIGMRLQSLISAWVEERLSEFPRLLAGDFAGKVAVVQQYDERIGALRSSIEDERNALSKVESLYVKIKAAIDQFARVRPARFRRALWDKALVSRVPAWYITGLYAPWEPMPEWFKTVLTEYGS